MKTTLKYHVHLYSWGVRKIFEGRAADLNNDDFCVVSTDISSDNLFAMCEVEVELDIPEAEQVRLMALAGIKKEKTKVKAEYSRTMDELSEKAEKYMALPAPPKRDEPVSEQ